MRTTTVVRKNATTLMQRGLGGDTRGEVCSGRSARQFGLIGRNDASGVANARGNLAADPEGRAQKKNVVGFDCDVVAKTTEFFRRCSSVKGIIQSRHSHRSVPISLSHSEFASNGRFDHFKAKARHRSIESGGEDRVAVMKDKPLRVV
jgi:hypothetical protein